MAEGRKIPLFGGGGVIPITGNLLRQMPGLLFFSLLFQEIVLRGRSALGMLRRSINQATFSRTGARTGQTALKPVGGCFGLSTAKNNAIKLIGWWLGRRSNGGYWLLLPRPL
jgi:hypothetical protein